MLDSLIKPIVLYGAPMWSPSVSMNKAISEFLHAGKVSSIYSSYFKLLWTSFKFIPFSVILVRKWVLIIKLQAFSCIQKILTDRTCACCARPVWESILSRTNHLFYFTVISILPFLTKIKFSNLNEPLSIATESDSEPAVHTLSSYLKSHLMAVLKELSSHIRLLSTERSQNHSKAILRG